MSMPLFSVPPPPPSYTCSHLIFLIMTFSVLMCACCTDANLEWAPEVHHCYWHWLHLHLCISDQWLISDWTVIDQWSVSDQCVLGSYFWSQVFSTFILIKCRICICCHYNAMIVNYRWFWIVWFSLNCRKSSIVRVSFFF